MWYRQENSLAEEAFVVLQRFCSKNNLFLANRIQNSLGLFALTIMDKN